MDASSLDALYREWYPPLWRFAYTLTQSGADAQDIVHDVFTGLLSRKREEITTSLESYLFRAVRNAALDRWRHHKVVVRVERERADETIAMAETPVTPDVVAEESDVNARLGAAIAALPERQRTAIILRWHHGMNAAQVGRVMAISDTAARKLLATAEAKLRALF